MQTGSVRRVGYRFRRGWALLGFAVFAVGVVGAALFGGFFGDGDAALELVALDAAGQFVSTVQVPAELADTTAAEPDVVARVPLVLAVRNVGRDAGAPGHLDFSLPTRFRIVRSDGTPLPSQLSAGSPLARYRLETEFPTFEPGRLPEVIPGDTLWLEAVIPTYYCTAFSDSVPEFVVAPPVDADAISRVQIFYAFEGGDLGHRQTGLLIVALDPALLRRPPVEEPPSFPTTVREPGVPLPYLEGLTFAGSHQASCGDPDDPLEILTTQWKTASGGRFLVVDYGGAPRKYLFDLDQDSIIELEMWDPDADGKFEAARQAYFPIPSFLLPPSTAADAGMLAMGAAWCSIFDTCPPVADWAHLLALPAVRSFEPWSVALGVGAPPPRARDTAGRAVAAGPAVRPWADIFGVQTTSAAAPAVRPRPRQPLATPAPEAPRAEEPAEEDVPEDFDPLRPYIRPRPREQPQEPPRETPEQPRPRPLEPAPPLDTSPRPPPETLITPRPSAIPRDTGRPRVVTPRDTTRVPVVPRRDTIRPRVLPLDTTRGNRP